VGYCGGDKKNPTYHSLGNHSEAVEIQFKPSVVSYDQLLKHFFEWHDSTEQCSTQYRSAIFVVSDAQEAAAHKVKVSISGSATAIERFKFWTDAEEYHQLYLKKNRY